MIGKKNIGFTLIELMVVLLIISVLAGIVTPVVTRNIEQAKNAALQENLFVIRKTLDHYYGDKGHYPETLKQLVDDNYLRNLPKDPFTEDKDSWITSLDEEGRIYDIHSGYEGIADDGSHYSEW